MGEKEFNIIAGMIEQHQEATCKMLTGFQLENREAIKRVHERLDVLLAKETVIRPDCEKYRRDCKKDMLAEVAKSTGVPTWVFALGTVAASLIVGMAIYIMTGDKQAAALIMVVM